MSLPVSSSPVTPLSRAVLSVGVLPPAVGIALEGWLRSRGLVLRQGEALELPRDVIRTLDPVLILVNACAVDPQVMSLLDELRSDSRLQTLPVCVVGATRDAAAWLNAGADDLLSDEQTPDEIVARLTAALRRSHRDIQVNPSTRLTGADAIAAAIAERVDRGELFAACYADLDHFKEFNDRYGYAMGDDVIRSIAALLVDVVDATAGARGFVGHIGGDDFLFLVPLERVNEACDTLVRRADETLPKRYSAHDRQAGYFFGKDRRGRLDRVPLMTLSIGVVTNERRRFTHAAQVSELATEMKTYAKTLPGSVWAMDRRSDGESAYPPEEKHQ